MTKIEETLKKQIEAANLLLQRVAGVPDGFPSRNLAGFITYDEKFKAPLARDVNAWVTETTELLRVLYGEEARQVYDFLNCKRPNNHYFDFREDLKKDLNRCQDYLNALIKADNMKQQISSETAQSMDKPPMVFISHSSKDVEFAEALVVMLEDLGFDKSNLFCSSVEGYGIGLSEDIFDTLRNLFNQYNLFVIFIHSPRYYRSPVSLNEMGAAWVLRTDFCSFLTTDMDFAMMKGVVDDCTISIKVDSKDAPARLTELKDKIIPIFGLNSIDGTKWERKRKAFLDKVNSIQYTEEIIKTEDKDSLKLSEKDKDVLTKWVESDYPYSIQRNFMGNRTVYSIGSTNYEAISSEEKAEMEDFFERLVSYGLIEYIGNDNSGHPKYKLKLAAYNFVKQQNNK